MRAHPLGLLALTACSTPDATRDMEAYLAAARAETVDASLARCEGIARVELRGECKTHAANRAAETRDTERAQAICSQVQAIFWREECWFLTTDTLALTANDAILACRNAGRYRQNCLGHAIGREVKDTELRYGKVGQEIALRGAIHEVVRRYKPNAPDAMRAVTSETLTARIIASRWEEGAFDRTLCGRASDAICTRAYRTNLDATPPEIDMEGLCSDGPPTREAVAAIGARTWTDASAPLAREAWTVLCRDLQSGRIARDGSKAMGLAPRRAPPRPGSLPGEEITDEEAP